MSEKFYELLYKVFAAVAERTKNLVRVDIWKEADGIRWWNSKAKKISSHEVQQPRVPVPLFVANMVVSRT